MMAPLPAPDDDELDEDEEDDELDEDEDEDDDEPDEDEELDEEDDDVIGVALESPPPQPASSNGTSRNGNTPEAGIERIVIMSCTCACKAVRDGVYARRRVTQHARADIEQVSRTSAWHTFT
jgi:hypothetical protein